MALADLSDVLWHERGLLDTLLYRLECEHLIVSAGMTDRLGRATDEVEQALAAISTAEIGRAADSELVATEFGLAPDAPLGALADAAPSPWDQILRDHRDAFLQLTTAITAASRGNRDILAAAHHATQETLASLHENLGTYDQHGASSAHLSTDAHIVDTSL
jgi:FlgN protein.